MPPDPRVACGRNDFTTEPVECCCNGFVTTFSGNIDGVGGLTKSTVIGITGKDTLTLTGTNTYAGVATINAGGAQIEALERRRHMESTLLGYLGQSPVAPAALE